MIVVLRASSSMTVLDTTGNTDVILFFSEFLYKSNNVSSREAAYRAALKDRDDRIAALEAEKHSHDSTASSATAETVSTGDIVQDWITSLE
jgi:hypothetical protein